MSAPEERIYKMVREEGGESACAIHDDEEIVCAPCLVAAILNLLAAEREAGRNEALPAGFLLMSRDTFDRNINEAREAGRREGIEEAAKLAAAQGRVWMEAEEATGRRPNWTNISAVAGAIRALVGAGGGRP